MSNLVGHQLGKYELTSLLGRGGMADVYGAYQTGLERLVAIKVLQGYSIDSQEMIARFKREARSVALLRHTNIVQVFDFDVEADLYYMVMEYIKGGTLGQLIRTDGALPSYEALHLATQLADGLYYAHQRGVIHRDVKPVNIMFTDKDHRHPVITDFGIAHIMDDPVILTAAGRPLGSPAYISPEVARGEQADERSDIYSFGVTLYEMLTGQIPFKSTTSDGFVAQHMNSQPPPARYFNAALPPEVEGILTKALAKRREQRFQTALEFKMAIQQVQDALSTRPLYAYSSAPPPPRHHSADSVVRASTRILPAMPFEDSIQVRSQPIEFGRQSASPVELIEDKPDKPARKRNYPFIIMAFLAIISGVGGLLLSQQKQIIVLENTSVPSATPTATILVPQSVQLTATYTEMPPTNAPQPTVEEQHVISNDEDRRSQSTEVTPEVTETVSATVSATPTKGTGTPVASPSPTRTPRPTQKTPTATMTPTRRATATATLRPTNVTATHVPPTTVPPTSVPPTNVPQSQPTAIPPTNVPPPQPTAIPPTNVPPPQPTAVPPTSVPPPQPTSVPPTTPPLIPPIIPTLLPILPTLLPGLPGL